MSVRSISHVAPGNCALTDKPPPPPPPQFSKTNRLKNEMNIMDANEMVVAGGRIGHELLLMLLFCCGCCYKGVPRA